MTANAVISAVGQLNRPKWPDIPGQDKFKGISFHSTEWEHEHDLKGKRVLVIGTGASAFQFAPEVAKEAKEVVIFQRTPPWVSMTPEYHDNVPDGKHWLLNHVPYYAKWYRFAMFWRMAEGILAAVKKDPAWNDQKHSISAENDELRKMFTQILEELCGEDKELLAKVTPQYPPGGKRILFDNGNWIRALRRDNVKLVTDRIAEINETGVKTARRQAVRRRRADLRHRFPREPFPVADAGERKGRRRSADAVERRSARVSRHHDSELPEPVLPVRAEHQHRGERQHRVLLRMRSALRAELHPDCCSRKDTRRSTARRTCTMRSTR